MRAREGEVGWTYKDKEKKREGERERGREA